MWHGHKDHQIQVLITSKHMYNRGDTNCFSCLCVPLKFPIFKNPRWHTVLILARSAKWPNKLYILPSVISSFFYYEHWAKLSQYLLDRFSWSFHQMEGICVNFINVVQFFQFLKGRCHGNQFSGKNGAKLPIHLYLSLWHYEMEWHIA